MDDAAECGGLSGIIGKHYETSQIGPLAKCLETGRIITQTDYGDSIELETYSIDGWIALGLKGRETTLGALIAEGEDVGATGVFDPTLEGRKLTFQKDGEQITDVETGTTWNVLGQAIDGELAGQSLQPIVHGNHFWFSWAAFKPDTLIYGS